MDGSRNRALAPPRRQAVAVQVGATRIEPALGTLEAGMQPANQPPEPRRVIELEEMRHFMGGEIVEYERRRQDEPPGERQHAGRRARAPAARLIAHRNSPDL